VSADAPPAVSREERKALLAAAAACFCLLGGYYVLRPIREALALEVGVRNNFLLFLMVLAASSVMLPVYWWLVGRIPRTRLLWLVNITFALAFIALALGLDAMPRNRVLAAVYFVSLTTFNLLLIAVFWSAMSDVWRPDLAKRFYGYVAAGGSVGAIVGNLVVRSLVVENGLPPLIVGACLAIVLSGALVSMARTTLRRAELGRVVPDGAIPVGGRALDDLKRLVTSPYLLGIAGVIIIGQTIGAFMYNEQGKYVLTLYPSDVERAAMFANLEIAVNLVALFFQAVVVTWLTKRGSVALSFSAMPALVGVSFVVLALVPTGAVLLITQVIRRAADYGLGKPPREMLFTVLNPESKFKSKSLIDTVLQRGSDTGGQALYKLVEGIGVVGMSWLCVALCVGLLFSTRTLGRAFESRRELSADAAGRNA
jgi:ATP:ADP antiporter, AAA family